MWIKVGKIDGVETKYCAKDLQEGKEYYFRVSAENEVGISEPLEMDSAVVPKSGFGMLDSYLPACQITSQSDFPSFDVIIKSDLPCMNCNNHSTKKLIIEAI